MLQSIVLRRLLMNSISDLQNRLEIKAVGQALPRGSTSNDSSCPWCGVDKSFSVTHTWLGDIAFMCHRASCGQAGYIKERGVRGPAQTKRVFTPRVFHLDTQRVEGVWESHLLAAYGVTRPEIDWAGWRYSPDGDRLCMPVLSPYSESRGWVTKRLVPSTAPKSDTFREVDDVWLGWYIRQGAGSPDPKGVDDEVIIVEDLISAMVASRYAKAVALLGTHLNDAMLAEILGVSKNVTICLDRDATDKALNYARRYGLFGNFSVVPLSKDVKDMNKEELKEWNVRIRRNS